MKIMLSVSEIYMYHKSICVTEAKLGFFQVQNKKW